MKWSFKLARFFGIDVYIHQTFFLLLLFFAWQGYSFENSLADAANGVLFICALFACVVLHEYGHALMARRFGIKTQHITLLPIGGVAAMEKMPEKPSQELLVALAGPAVNFVIAGLLYLWLQINPQTLTYENLENSNIPLTLQLLVVNIFLAAFNLIPAFPMDGGRVLRALFAMKVPYATATDWASKIGKGFAIAFAIYGVYSGNMLLTLIAVFLWLGGTAENRATQFKKQVQDLSISHVLQRQFVIAQADDSMKVLDNLASVNSQPDFPVALDSNYYLLSFKNWQKALQETPEALVKEQNLEPVMLVDESLTVAELVAKLKQQPVKMVLVQNAQHIVGIIGLQQILALAEL